jgi:hypothetical protein
MAPLFWASIETWPTPRSGLCEGSSRREAEAAGEEILTRLRLGALHAKKMSVSLVFPAILTQLRHGRPSAARRFVAACEPQSESRSTEMTVALLARQATAA